MTTRDLLLYKGGVFMIRVIKKGGRIVEFAPEKISTSLANCSSDLKTDLNKVDADLLAKDVEKKIRSLRGNDGITSSHEIISLVLESLNTMGFKKIAESYYNNCY